MDINDAGNLDLSNWLAYSAASTIMATADARRYLFVKIPLPHGFTAIQCAAAHASAARMDDRAGAIMKAADELSLAGIYHERTGEILDASWDLTRAMEIDPNARSRRMRDIKAEMIPKLDLIATSEFACDIERISGTVTNRTRAEMLAMEAADIIASLITGDEDRVRRRGEEMMAPQKSHHIAVDDVLSYIDRGDAELSSIAHGICRDRGYLDALGQARRIDEVTSERLGRVRASGEGPASAAREILETLQSVVHDKDCNYDLGHMAPDPYYRKQVDLMVTCESAAGGHERSFVRLSDLMRKMIREWAGMATEGGAASGDLASQGITSIRCNGVELYRSEPETLDELTRVGRENEMDARGEIAMERGEGR